MILINQFVSHSGSVAGELEIGLNSSKQTFRVSRLLQITCSQLLKAKYLKPSDSLCHFCVTASSPKIFDSYYIKICDLWAPGANTTSSHICKVRSSAHWMCGHLRFEFHTVINRLMHWFWPSACVVMTQTWVDFTIL